MEPHRVSQRPTLACRECTRRKRKCDKTVPCSRCKRLGLNCAREVVHLRGRLTRHGQEIDFLSRIADELRVATPSDIARIVQKINERIDSVKSGAPSSAKEEESEAQHNDQVMDQHDQEADSLSPPGQDFSVVTAVEHLAWGRSYGNCYPHRQCVCKYRRHWHGDSYNNSLSFELALSHMAGSIILPNQKDSETLMSFHMRHITWHHNCIHVLTFWEQCQVFWSTGRCDQPQWLALYCAILSTSLFCLQHSPLYSNALSLDTQIQTPQALFDTMVSLLYASDFLKDLSIYAVQAIVISTEVAHNLGLSELNATLFSAAIRIAECLGLHKIEDQTTTSLSPAEAWCQNVEIEVGKRVWCQMVIQDHFAIPFTDSYGINPSHYSTAVPKNANDIDLIAVPDRTLTISTYTRVLISIAKLMPDLVNGLGPLRDRKDLLEQYQHILRMDLKMRQVVSAIPGFLLRQDLMLESQVPWLGIARQSLAITAAEKIIMIHRPFLFRSFHSQDYVFTRKTCVSAASTILREHQNIFERGDLSLWTHTAFCITAAVVLCFEINIARAQISEETFKTHHETIQAARLRLMTRKQDTLAQRGVFLINTILPEVEGGTPVPNQAQESALSNAVNFKEVAARFSTEWTLLGVEFDSDTLNSGAGAFPLATEHQREQYVPGYESAVDFEAWFNDVFAISETLP